MALNGGRPPDGLSNWKYKQVKPLAGSDYRLQRDIDEAVDYPNRQMLSGPMQASSGEPIRSNDAQDLLPTPRPWQTFWRNVIRFDRNKLIPWVALRNAIGILLPIAIGLETGHVLGGLAVGSGALNVSFSDGQDPYRQRAQRMLASSALTAVAVFLGGILGRHYAGAVLIAAAWAFASGMAVALGTTAADLGVISVVILLVYSAQALTTERVVYAGLLAFGGGLLQTALALLWWPAQRYAPERAALASVYRELAKMAAASVESNASLIVFAQAALNQPALASLGQDHSVEGERYRSLLNQAERLRLGLLTLARLRRRMRRDNDGGDAATILDQFAGLSAGVLAQVASSLSNPELSASGAGWLKQIERLTGEFYAKDWQKSSTFIVAMIQDARFQLSAIEGQLRAVADLATHATVAGGAKFAERQAQRPYRLRIAGALATLRANLSLNSAVFRHAIRLAACVALADGVGRAFDWRRSYWLPMTAVIVLKPDFGSTFSRGTLRLSGTFVGLLLATALYHFVNPSAGAQVMLIAVFAYLMRWLGPANYGILVVSISALIVLLIAMTGIAPKQVILARGLTTGAGGALALLAYALWPTWERTQIQETLAQMLDGYRAYFQGIAGMYKTPGKTDPANLDSVRLSTRLARSNFEAAVDRIAAEPGMTAEQMALFAAILATSRRFAEACMALDSGLSTSSPAAPRDAFFPFASNVELTLYLLASALRGSANVRKGLPDLREDHRRLVQAGDSSVDRYALVDIETDRLTNSLNTLSGQVFRWIARKR